MAREDTQFSKDNQPKKRSRAFKNRLWDAIKKEALLEVGEKSSNSEVEEAFLCHVAKRAFDGGDSNSATLLKELLSKSYASVKSTLPQFEFDFNAGASPVTQVNQLIAASSQGHIPADVAAIFIQSVKDAAIIEEKTDVKERLEKVEEMLKNGQS